MPEYAYLHQRGEFICSHGTGHYPVWAKDTIHGHACNCCLSPGFPGREPKRGDIALCGRGSLGIIVDHKKRKVCYGDGNDAMAWMGFHLTNAIIGVGSVWSSKNPCIIGNINQFAFSPTNNVEWADTLYEFVKQNPVENWPWKKPRTSLTVRSREQIAEIVNFFVERP
jgi:hypothetical protein